MLADDISVIVGKGKSVVGGLLVEAGDDISVIVGEGKTVVGGLFVDAGDIVNNDCVVVINDFPSNCLTVVEITAVVRIFSVTFWTNCVLETVTFSVGLPAVGILGLLVVTVVVVAFGSVLATRSIEDTILKYSE